MNELINTAHTAAKEKGFWDKPSGHEVELSFITQKIMLIVSELSEAVEALRDEKFTNNEVRTQMVIKFDTNVFKEHIKNTFEDEIADTFIRLLDLCGYMNIDIDTHIALKMKYNKSRGYKHNRKF